MVAERPSKDRRAMALAWPTRIAENRRRTVERSPKCAVGSADYSKS